MPFDFSPTEIPSVILVEPRVFEDRRGYFMESYRLSEFQAVGIVETFVQDNQSLSVRNTLRGLHYQVDPFAQGKLIRCLRGEIWDVAVDLRESSPSFGKWVARILSAENNRMLYVPPGFAHGFQVVSDLAEVSYKCTAEYAPQAERSIVWNDPDLAINWPVKGAIVSEKDRIAPTFEQFRKTTIQGSLPIKFN